MIEANNISKIYTHANSSVSVFEHVNLTIHKNKVQLITGVSGSGKSTLLHLLSGLDTPTSGTILYNGENIQTMSDKKYEAYQKAVSFVFQFPHLIAELSILENTMLSARATGIPAEKAQKNALALLERVGLHGLANRWPHELSGGQKQRVALARSLCSNPQFLFADEPTGSLDSTTGAEILTLLQICTDEFDIGVVLTSHDPKAKHYADCIMKMDEKQYKKHSKPPLRPF